jgi:hypothetical protein
MVRHSLNNHGGGMICSLPYSHSSCKRADSNFSSLSAAISVLRPTGAMQHFASLRFGQVSVFEFELTVDEDVLDSL